MILKITTIEYLIPVVSGTILFGLLTVFIVYFILAYRKTQVKLDFERERLKSELLRVENEVKEQTLTNVSRELHDNFGQVASLININLNLLKSDLTPTQTAQVDESKKLIKQLIQDIKQLSKSINGDRITQIGWLKSIENEVSRINKSGAIEIQFETKGNSTLSDEKQVFLYRIVQELLNNTMKHAKASKAALHVDCSKDSTAIQFSDNGIGFDLKTTTMGSGIGNIEERCKMIDAEFVISSNKGTGIEVRITL